MAMINRQSIRILSRLFNITGIILPTFVKSRSRSFLGHILTCLNLAIIGTAILTVAVYVYVHRSVFSESSLGLPYVGVGCGLVVTFLTFLGMRNEMGHLMLRLDQNVFTYAQEMQIRTDYPWLYRESSTKTVYTLVFVYEYLGVIPCLFPLFDRFVFKRKTLSFPGWTPWNQEEHFFATYATQVSLAIGVCWLISIIQLFILFGVIEFARQNMRLCAALSSVERRSEKSVMAKIKCDDSSTVDQREQNKENLLAIEFQINIKQCIEHHQKVVELFRIFQSWFSIVFFVELLADASTFAIIFYNLFQISAEVAYSALIGSSFIFITSLFTRCLAGEIFSDMNEKIATVIFYEIRWYEQTLSNKKLLFIFHSQVRRPLDLYAFSIFKASFFTFTSLIKTSYSYLNILKASFSFKN